MHRRCPFNFTKCEICHSPQRGDGRTIFVTFTRQRRFAMLGEKFFLMLETLRSHASDAGVRVVSTSPHVPIKLPPKP
jgi:hypothetical protein